MLADIHILHRSEFYKINDFRCHCDFCSLSEPEYNRSFFMSFIREGFFEYRTFRREDELHVGRLLLSKPGYEHTTRHIDDQPDMTTGFEFTTNFFRDIQEQFEQARWFLKNDDIHALMLGSNAGLDYLHHRILQLLQSKEANSLQLDEMVIEMLGKVMQMIGNTKEPSQVPASFKQLHLGTVEKAKSYMLQHFSQDISLQQLARHCLVSPFHFSRIFKSVMNVSPHQYLAELRLNHARILLSSTADPVTDIAYASGFNSLEHFATSYRRRYKVSPTAFRSGVRKPIHH